MGATRPARLQKRQAQPNQPRFESIATRIRGLDTFKRVLDHLGIRYAERQTRGEQRLLIRAPGGHGIIVQDGGGSGCLMVAGWSQLQDQAGFGPEQFLEQLHRRVCPNGHFQAQPGRCAQCENDAMSWIGDVLTDSFADLDSRELKALTGLLCSFRLVVSKAWEFFRSSPTAPLAPQTAALLVANCFGADYGQLRTSLDKKVDSGIVCRQMRVIEQHRMVSHLEFSPQPKLLGR